ncbi:MAG: hypothetical protein HKN47_06775 [Pirellulaceae bacterium]|nr:hypothetical protein [Pirellulaceae bacterium]
MTSEASVSLGLSSPRRSWHNIPDDCWQLVDHARRKQFWKPSTQTPTLIIVGHVDDVSKILQKTPTPLQPTLTFAWKAKRNDSNDAVAANTQACRERLDEMNLSGTRVIVASRDREDRLVDFLNLPAVDGIHHYGCGFADMLPVMKAAGEIRSKESSQ